MLTISGLLIIQHERNGSDVSRLFAVYKKLTDKIVAVYTKQAYRSRGTAPLTHNHHNQVEVSYQFTTQLLNPPLP
jgi:hypothetical protein